MQKIKNIEFLRIFLIITIVLFHMRVALNKIDCSIFHQMYKAFRWGSSSVEGFFIISGFFLVLTFKYKTTILEFIKKKYARLAPAAMFSVMVCGIASIFKIMKFKLIPNLASGLLLCNFGKYWCRGSNVALWYASALLFGLIVFFLILKYTKEKYHLTFFVLLAGGSFLLLSLLHGGVFNGYDKSILTNLLSVSTLRAIGGIGTGCVIAKLYQTYEGSIINFIPNKWQFILISSLELLSLGFIFWWSYFRHELINNIVYVLAFSVLFVCFLCGKSLLAQVTNKDIFTTLGKYSYSLFVIHIPIISIIKTTTLLHNKAFCAAHPFLIIQLLLLLTVFAAIITYYLVEKPCYNYFMSLGQKSNSPMH